MSEKQITLYWLSDSYATAYSIFPILFDTHKKNINL